MNIFEYATRQKIRFASARGELSVEQLWDVPLRSADEFNLNAVAKAASGTVKKSTEENFVEPTKRDIRAETALEVVKHVIGAKVADEETAKKKVENKKRREELLAALAEKQVGALSRMSVEKIQKQIAELDDE